MDKYEFNIKVEQIKKLVGKSDYGTAMKIADTIDWRRVRNTNLLSMVATIYEKNEDYEEAKEILLLAYERAPIGKRLLYKLAELALKQGSITEAEDYYKEFSDLASDDPRQQLLRYMILKAKGAPAQQLIHSLESYTSVELDEKWLYELAELYSLAGMSDRCVETCDKIMLMFGLGKYVDKAMDLKIQYAPLSNYQLDLVENRDKYEAKLREVEQQYNLGKKRAEQQEEYQEEPVYQQELQGDQVYGDEGYDNSYSEGSYGPEQGYEPAQNVYQGYGQDNGFASQQNYGQNPDYSQTSYEEGQSYMPGQEYGAGYGSAQGFADGQVYGQGPNEMTSQEYEAGQAYGAQVLNSQKSVKAQDAGFSQAPVQPLNYDAGPGYGAVQNYGGGPGYGVDQNYGHEQAFGTGSNYTHEQVYENHFTYGENPPQNSDYSADGEYTGSQEYGEPINYGADQAYGTENGYSGNEGLGSAPQYTAASEYDSGHYDEGQVYEADLGQAYGSGQSYEEHPAYDPENSYAPAPETYEPQNGFVGGAGSLPQNEYEDQNGYTLDSNEAVETGYHEEYNNYDTEYSADEAYEAGQPSGSRSFHSEPPEMSGDDYLPEQDYSGYESDYGEVPLSGKALKPVQEDVEAELKEAEVQEKLAREMSRITREELVLQEESTMEHTRVLDDIRRVGRPITAIPRPRGVFIPEEEDSASMDSEPVIEEDIVEGPGLEEDGDEYDRDLPEDSYSDEYAGPDFVYQQSAVTSEDQEKPVMLSEAKTLIAHGKQFDGPKDYEEDELEFEDLDEDEEETPVLNHLMIEARTPEKGMQMAVEALKQIHRENGIKNPVAKISGAKLAKRGILASAEKLAGKDLVVEEAGDLTANALEELNRLMEYDTSGMIVVLIDNPKQMEMLHRDYPALASKFECIGKSESSPDPKPSPVKTVPVHRESDTKQVKAVKPQAVKTLNYRAEEPEPAGYFRSQPPTEPVPEEMHTEEPGYKTTSWLPESYEEEDYYQETYEDEPAYGDDDFYEEGETEERPSVRDEEGPGFHGEEMDIDEFAQYACRYANEIDCSITGKSMLALYERIEIMEEDGVPLIRTNAEDLIEEAADRAEKPSFGKRIKGLFSSKYDKDGLLILKEEHFIY